jgi:predicted DNA-binding antitoxin AbrB/MazE fold protein
MTRVQAIFEKGVFRPTEPVQIDDGARVELTIEEQ